MQSDTTILIASHDVGVIRKLADRIVIIYKGKVQNVSENDNMTNNLIEQKYLDIISI